MTGSVSIGVYMWTPHTLLRLFSVRSSEVKHEHLRDSLHGAEDALGRARHMEERSRAGGTTNSGATNHNFRNYKWNSVWTVCVFMFSGEAGSAGSFRLWVQTHWLRCCVQQWAGGGRGSGCQARPREGEKLWIKFELDTILRVYSWPWKQQLTEQSHFRIHLTFH